MRRERSLTRKEGFVDSVRFGKNECNNWHRRFWELRESSISQAFFKSFLAAWQSSTEELQGKKAAIVEKKVWIGS